MTLSLGISAIYHDGAIEPVIQTTSHQMDDIPGMPA